MVIVITIIGAVVHGSTGIGLGLVAGPALLAIDPRFVPGPLLLSSILIGFRHVAAERANIDRSTLARLLLGMPVGVVAAIVLLTTVEERTMAIAVGGLVIVAVGALLAGFQLPRTPRFEVLGGAGAAFTAVTAALPGPPLVMTLHDSPGPVMRPTVGASSMAISLTTALSLAVVGRFGSAELLLLAILVPAVLFGLVIARFVRPWLDREFFRPVILCLALAGGAGLILRNI